MQLVVVVVVLLLSIGRALAQDASVSDAPAASPEPPAAPAAPAPEPVQPEPVQPEPVQSEPSVESEPGLTAVAVIPQPGRGVSADRVPRNVQRVDRASLDSMHALGAHDAINAKLGSVVVNDVQNNPLQPDLQYRGFTASPLLGTPQGLAVYQNGVRIHDPLGDVVQWDLVPEHAIESIELVPGANPLYGQNALGGGLSLRMKNGFSAPGYRVEASAGSFERYRASAEYGRIWDDEWAAYASASLFGEEGFRDISPTSARHAYVDLRQRDPKQEVGISATLADTRLYGNGPAPIELLRRDRAAVFTYPDITQNDLLMVAADARRELWDDIFLSGNAYFRHLVRDTLNGDEGEFTECASGFLTLVCDEDGEGVVTETGSPIESPALLGIFDGVNNTTSTSSLVVGGSAQLAVERDVLRKPNQLAVGVSADRSALGFVQRAELGHLTEARGVEGQGIYAGNDFFHTELDVETENVGVYVTDTLTVLPPLSVQLSGRLGYTHLKLIDRDGTALDGDHGFVRFNPATGITYRPIEPIAIFVSYSEGSRAPSAIELACADPEEPCRVPNALLSDPPLRQVITRSVELGVRGTHGRTHLGRSVRPRYEWSVAGFGSRNLDDILFVAGSAIGTGYFRNAGQTQRVGVELGASANLGLVEAYASYTLLRATFETPLTLPAVPSLLGGDAGDDEDEGVEVLVERGDRMPGIPTHSFKAGVTLHPIEQWDIGASVLAQSDRPYRGDEANLIDGVNGYAVVSAFTGYWVFEELQLFIKAENLFDAEYETFGLIADPGDVLDDVTDPRFQSPGAPLGVWAGVVVRGF